MQSILLGLMTLNRIPITGEGYIKGLKENLEFLISTLLNILLIKLMRLKMLFLRLLPGGIILRVQEGEASF